MNLHDSAEHEYSYSFLDFTLDLAAERLVRGANEIKLRPKSFQVLRYLIERHGRLVTRDELMQAVWGDIAVTDESISKCIAALLSDPGCHHRPARLGRRQTLPHLRISGCAKMSVQLSFARWPGAGQKTPAGSREDVADCDAVLQYQLFAQGNPQAFPKPPAVSPPAPAACTGRLELTIAVAGKT